MWQDLSVMWQTTFEEGWNAYKAGSIPIGAAIFDQFGKCLIREHNRSMESETLNKSISHAEANALRALDTSKCNVRELTLYTTMEPCPMCMGTSVMSNIKHLRYAAHDPYCGSVYLKDTDPYICGKNLDYVHEGGDPELVQLVLQSCYELNWIDAGHSDIVLKQFQEYKREAVEIACQIHKQRLMEKYTEENVPFAVVYDRILQMHLSA